MKVDLTFSLIRCWEATFSFLEAYHKNMKNTIVTGESAAFLERGHLQQLTASLCLLFELVAILWG